MKTVLKTLLFLTLVTSALADDAAIKKQLVGTWTSAGQTIVLNADGSMDNPIKTWDVRDGKYIETKKSGATYTFSVLKITKTSVTLREESHSRGTGIGPASNERRRFSTGSPGESKFVLNVPRSEIGKQ